MKPVKLALAGATGIVGRTTLDVLAEWQVPIASVRLLASAGSAGQSIRFRDQYIQVEALDGVPEDVNVAIFATSSVLSAQWVPQFRDSGILVIDHSSRFRQDSDVPLVIPEINGSELQKHQGLVSNPNCSASVILLPLFALSRRFGLQQVITATYQSVSGAGSAAIRELALQHERADAPREIFPQQLAHNVIPEIGAIDGSGVSGEEQKICDEIRKILSLRDLPILSTTVRVPVHTGHSAALAIQLNRSADRDAIEQALSTQEGLVYESTMYRTPLEIAGKQEVFAGRLRIDSERPDWIQLWVTGDNLRKGAASNAVQILQELFS